MSWSSWRSNRYVLACMRACRSGSCWLAWQAELASWMASRARRRRISAALVAGWLACWWLFWVRGWCRTRVCRQELSSRRADRGRQGEAEWRIGARTGRRRGNTGRLRRACAYGWSGAGRFGEREGGGPEGARAAGRLACPAERLRVWPCIFALLDLCQLIGLAPSKRLGAAARV